MSGGADLPHLEILVEEPSAETALAALVPKIVGENATFAIRVFSGKQRLLRRLPDRLRAYAKWIPPSFRIVVLIDRDQNDCHDLKARIKEAARLPGLRPGQVLCRIAIEELEAWYFGDIEALRNAYPQVPATLASRAPYRDPDDIRGGTWERLESVLQRSGYHRGGLMKIQLARDVARHMIPESNRSRSFQVFRQGLVRIIR